MRDDYGSADRTAPDARYLRDHVTRAGRGEPLLLLHGLGHDRTAWDPVLEGLARSYDVAAIDLPGFGGAPALDAEPTIEALAEWCEAVIDALGWDAAHVAGNSLGGLVAIALGGGSRTRSVTALSPAGMVRGPEHLWTTGVLRLVRAVAPRLADVRWLTDSPRARRLLLGAMFGRPSNMTPDYARAAMAAPGASTAFEETRRAVALPDPLVEPTVPVTIAWGTRDLLLFPWQASRWGQALPAALVVELEGMGHVPMPDDPDRIIGVINATAARRQTAA